MAEKDASFEGKDWNAVAAAYREKINNITKNPAKDAVEMAAKLRPIDKTSRVIDVGSGAGSVTQYVAETTSAQITAVDSAQNMLDVIQVPDGTSLERKLLDANLLSQTFPAETFSHAFCTFVLHVVSDEMNVVREMRKILQPDGVIGVAVWGLRMDNIHSWEEACRTIDPGYELPKPLQRGWSWRTPEVLRQKLETAGFKDIETTGEILLPFNFTSAAEWTKFAFEAKHPVEEMKLRSWNGDREAVREAVLKIAKENYDDAKGMKASAVIAVARV